MNKIITIGREFGSGGRELGRRLAEELQIAYYDREILTELSKRTSFSENYIRKISEQRPAIQFPITIGRSFYPIGNPVLEQSETIYLEQSRIIREMAMKSDCIIVGRCADYVLQDRNLFRIFVYADIKSRMKRCREKASQQEAFSDKDLKQHILNIDKNRAKYYEFYTGQSWGNKQSYDLCVNTSQIAVKDLVPAIAKMLTELYHS